MRKLEGVEADAAGHAPRLGRLRHFVVLQPEKHVGHVCAVMALDQRKDPPQQLAKRQVVRDNDSSMMAPGSGVFLCQSYEVFYVERQDDSPLTDRKSKLL